MNVPNAALCRRAPLCTVVVNNGIRTRAMSSLSTAGIILDIILRYVHHLNSSSASSSPAFTKCISIADCSFHLIQIMRYPNDNVGIVVLSNDETALRLMDIVKWRLSEGLIRSEHVD